MVFLSECSFCSGHTLIEFELDFYYNTKRKKISENKYVTKKVIADLNVENAYAYSGYLFYL